VIGKLLPKSQPSLFPKQPTGRRSYSRGSEEDHPGRFASTSHGRGASPRPTALQLRVYMSNPKLLCFQNRIHAAVTAEAARSIIWDDSLTRGRSITPADGVAYTCIYEFYISVCMIL